MSTFEPPGRDGRGDKPQTSLEAGLQFKVGPATRAFGDGNGEQEDALAVDVDRADLVVATGRVENLRRATDDGLSAIDDLPTDLLADLDPEVDRIQLSTRRGGRHQDRDQQRQRTDLSECREIHDGLLQLRGVSGDPRPHREGATEEKASAPPAL
jgi:hypothetical protein